MPPTNLCGSPRRLREAQPALSHAEDAPAISDAGYDALIARNNTIEAAFPHLVRGGQPQRISSARRSRRSPLAKVRHEQRLYSLDNGFSDTGISRNFSRVCAVSSACLKAMNRSVLDGGGQDRRAVALATV